MISCTCFLSALDLFRSSIARIRLIFERIEFALTPSSSAMLSGPLPLESNSDIFVSSSEEYLFRFLPRRLFVHPNTLNNDGRNVNLTKVQFEITILNFGHSNVRSLWSLLTFHSAFPHNNLEK